MNLKQYVIRFYKGVVSARSLKFLLVLIFLVGTFVLLKNIFIILLMLFLGAASLLHNIFTRNTLGLELCTFATVFSAMQFGAGAGMFVGVFSILIGMTLSRNIDEGVILMVIGFALMGFLASLFDFTHIFIVGMAATIGYDLITVGFYLLMGSSPVKSVSYVLTHLVINFYIFKYLPGWLINLV